MRAAIGPTGQQGRGWYRGCVGAVVAEANSSRAVRPPASRAASALVVAQGLSAVVVALMSVPAHWTHAERSLSATAALPTPLTPLWHGLARGMPIADLPVRPDLFAAALVLVNAAAATVVALAVFRGPGRWLASVAAGPVTTLLLSRWALVVGAASAVTGLTVSLLATLALALVVHARVHIGRVTPVAAARAGAAVSATALISLRAALPLLLMLILMTAATARLRRPRPSRTQEPDDASPRPPAPPLRTWLIAAALGMAPAILALTVLAGLRGMASFPDLRTIRVALPAPALLSTPGFAGIVFVAAALLVVMTFVLRWRGGPWLLAWAALPLTLYDAYGPLVPQPVVLVVLATAASGWVWLAGLAVALRPRLNLGFATFAFAGLFCLCALFGPWDQRARAPLAEQRPVTSLVSVYARGLLAPGDILLSADPWLRNALDDRRRVEGWRPDVLVRPADALPDETLARLSLDARGTGRRVLSDSYNLAGRWKAAWAIDSGPLFWLVGENDPSTREYTDLSLLFPTGEHRDAATMRRWHRLAIERARFRRAVGDPSAALGALPLSEDRMGSLATRLQLARSGRTEQAAGSELPAAIPTPEPGREVDDALILAETGDLLFSHGELERASELLIEAANSGYEAAWGALARWQLRTGSMSAATATMSAIAGSPELRGQAVGVLRWLLSRGRLSDARQLISVLGAPPQTTPLSATDATLETAARLQVLTAMAAPTSPTKE